MPVDISQVGIRFQPICLLHLPLGDLGDALLVTRILGAPESSYFCISRFLGYEVYARQA